MSVLPMIGCFTPEADIVVDGSEITGVNPGNGKVNVGVGLVLITISSEDIGTGMFNNCR